MKELRIPFKGWDLIAFLNEKDGNEMVAVKPIAMAIGVSWQPQHTKITSDPRFNYHDIVTVAEDGKQRKMLCLPIMELHGWMYTINSSRVKVEVRDRLLLFQRECHIAIDQYMKGRSNSQALDILYKLIDQQQKTIDSLQLIVSAQGQMLETHHKILGVDASCSGKKLAAARHLKLVGE